MNNKKYNLIKFGISETKRSNIKQSYTLLVDIINNNNNIPLTVQEIFQKMKNNRFYLEQKKEMKINRELSLIKKLNFAKIEENKDNKTYIFQKTKISENWENEKFNEKFFGLSSVDFSFFQLLLKMKYKSNNELKSVFFNLLTGLKKNNKLEKNIIMDIHYRTYIKKIIDNKNIDSLLKLISLKSGSANELQKPLNNNVIEYFLKIWKSNNANYSELYDAINQIYEKNLEFSDGISELIFGYINNKNGKEKIIKIKQFNKMYLENKEKLNSLIQESFENIEKRVIDRIIKGAWGSYRHLIKTHLNSIDGIFEFDHKDNFKIKDNFKYLIETILESGEKRILQLEEKTFYSPEELLHFFKLENKFIEKNLIKVINEYYSNKKLIDLFEKLKDIYSSKIENKELSRIIKNHEHIKGKVDTPTFFEFIIGMAFLSKNRTKKITNEKEYLESHFHTKLDTNLCPIRFAPGGRSDIFIARDDHKIFLNIEPTTQLYNQTKMELDPARNHLVAQIKKNKFPQGISIIVAPKINKNLFLDIIGWNNDQTPRLEIKLFNINLILEMLKSELDIFSFVSNNNIKENDLS